jgi:nitrite reductase/ring-hydroxylating ferredoxin subunit
MADFDEQGLQAGPDDCAGCTGRRDFLRDAAGIAAAFFVSLGAGSAAAQGMTLQAVRALSVRGGEATYPIPAADGATIDADREVILARYHGRVYAFSLSCPHKRTMLRWQPQEQRFQCPKHHSRYTPDGSYISGRATRSMDRYTIRRTGANVVVDTGRMLKQTDDRAPWETAFVAV